MRHASAAFTLAVYIHKDRTRMTATVANLPDLGVSSVPSNPMSVAQLA